MGDWSYIYYPFCFPIIIEELKKEMYKRGLLVYTRPTMNVLLQLGLPNANDNGISSGYIIPDGRRVQRHID